MNNRYEFDPEVFGDQPSSFEGEQEIKRRGGRPAAGRKTGATRKADSRRKPAAKPRPRPGKKFPIRHPVAALPYPVWPVLAPEPAKEPRGQEPRQDSAPSGSPPPPPDGDQAREGGEFVRWAQNTLNKALNLNLQTNGVMDDATRNAIRSFQEREGLQVTGAIGPDTEQALIAVEKKTAPATEEPPSGDAGPADATAPEQESWWSNEAEWEGGNIFSRMTNGAGDVFGRTADAVGGGSRIIDLTAKADKSVRKGVRDRKSVNALVLRQMGCCFKVKDPLTRFLKMDPHFVILPDGRILQLHPIAAHTLASNGFNKDVVAVEFAGNFPNTRGNWWNEKEAGKNQVTKEQIEAGRHLARHLIRTMGLTHIHAHRQSSATRENDPGPDIWYHVGQWAVDNLGLKDGGPGYKRDGGNPIPDLWRNWGKAKPNPELEAETGEEFESTGVCPPFIPAPMENPGGGRVQNKTAPRAGDIVQVNRAFGGAVPLHRLTAQALNAMQCAASAEGIKAPLLQPTSGFRDPAHQARLWEEAKIKYGSEAEARKWVAPPGGSAHQSGRAVDLHLGGKNDSANVAQLRTLPAYHWLVANAQRFGFYPYEREPWHWEYNPQASRGTNGTGRLASPSPVPAPYFQSPISALRATAVALANQELNRWGQGTVKESDPRLRPVIEGYWQNGPGYKPTEPNWWSAVPWSAAFISWLMRKAGAGADFNYSGSHAAYTAAAKQNRLANNNNPFKAYRITEAKPRVGDLVCKRRDGSGATYDNIASGMATHCDIVTAVEPNRLITVGGNVSDSVKQTVVPTDANGFINKSDYFAVIKVGA
jgi:peptidoglycan hydrolase-like protein with peptidoglycan-binding domain